MHFVQVYTHVQTYPYIMNAYMHAYIHKNAPTATDVFGKGTTRAAV